MIKDVTLSGYLNGKVLKIYQNQNFIKFHRFLFYQKNPSILNHLLTDINVWYLRCMKKLFLCSALQF